ncbi:MULTISPECIES: hypothetical protein [unclassified Rathayibacter]|jgi:hypothetical protein|uniref:hypothetical protein n=1 Tax=unclassified Rathayibacter TaxID=2609250 RepID=UPI000CE78171|nr:MULTISPECIES: hypothetical protein [unclassified Rathayibacter]PPF50144.1 hypothetical protein C5E14_02305 [Rathayibacter sp. AY1A1]PPH01424.1 hypothetical protein C5C32_05805 [Rathayibacter sp. AY1G9]
MAEDADLISELLEWLVPPDLKERPTAEQIATGTALLYRLKEAIATDPDALVRQANRRQVSPELPQLIGEVVIAAAWAEDAGGTFLQVTSGDWDKRAPGYDDTSSRLVRALRKKAPAKLVERLEAALELRHFVVHGIWVNGSFVKHPQTGDAYDFVSMKRRYRTDAPTKDSKAFMKSALKWLAQEFWEIEDELEKLHSEILFEKDGGGNADL